MPIFDNELIDNVSDRNVSPRTSTIASPTIKQINTSLPGPNEYGKESTKKTGLTIDELSNISVNKVSTFDSPFQSISRGELMENKRYPLYERGKDLENIYGLQQSWTDRLANSTIKFAATTLGTFLQGFATIPNTITAVKNGRIGDLSNPDGYERSIDTWLRNLEDNFPNYYTRYEREHPFLTMIPLTTGSANFWGDKILKNLGFTAGAITNAIVTDLAVGTITGGIGEIPLIASQVGRASLYLNKIFASTSKVDEVLYLARGLGKVEQQFMNVKRLGEIGKSIKLTSGPRYAMTLYGSARTEAAIEARDNFNRVKEELINQYRLDNLGEEPVGEELDKINNYAESAMNTRFGINMALLTVSNAVQFGSLFKSFNGTVRQLGKLENIALKDGSRDLFEKVAPISVSGKVWESVKPKVANVFSEGVWEEGGQYATERGTYNYYTRKYRSPENESTWNTLNESISSTLEGLKDQFGTTEGLENMIIGGITAMIAGGISGKIQSVRGSDKSSRDQAAINTLNQYGLTGNLYQQYTDTLNSVSIAKEMDEAIKSGDIYRYKNLKDDMFFNFVTSRLPSGMHDVTVEQLDMLRDLPKEEFERTFGMDFSEANISTVNEYVDSLIGEANYIKKVSDSVDLGFKNPFKPVINPQTLEEATEAQKFKTFNDWKTNLIYYGVASRQVNNRIADIQQSVSNIDPIVSVDVLSQLSNTEQLKELSREYEERAADLNKTITEYTSPRDKKNIRAEVRALRSFSEKINLSIKGTYDTKLFGDLLNFELNGQDATKDKIVGNENLAALFNYGVDVNKLNNRKKLASEIFDALSTEEGFNKFFEQEEKLEEPEEKKEVIEGVPEIITRAGVKEPIQEGREYLSYSDKKATVKKLADDRWEVTSPDGTSSFHPNQEAAKEEKEEIDDRLAATKKVKIIAINPDGTIKIEDVNGDIYDISPDTLTGYESVLTEQEKLRKFKEDLDREQADIETSSGTTATNDLSKDIAFSLFEEKKKAAGILFTSTTSASEDWEAGSLTPHNLRAIEFLNNAKNFKNKKKLRAILVTPNQEKSLGLEGLAALSLEGSGLETNKYTDLNEGFIATVYVEQSGKNVYFVDKDGKRLSKVGEKVDLGQVVFSTMPTTFLVRRDGKTSRYREGEKEEAAVQAKRWEAKRKQLFALPEGKYEIYSFGISRGIPNITDQWDRNPVGDTLVPEDKISTQEGLIVIPTTGKIFHQGELINFPNGRPLIQYGDTLQFLSNNNFTKKQVASIFEVIKLLSQDVKTQLAEGGRIRLNRKYTKFLQNVLFYKDAKVLTNNQFSIDTTSMEVRFGDKRWDLTKIEDFEKEITDKLSETYNSVNNFTLTKLFSEPFIELYQEEGKLKEREWTNYQTYLLSSAYPDDSKRDISDVPLSTSVNPITAAVPYNFKQKYAILQGMELPEVSVPKKVEPKVPEPPKIGDYVVDGTTLNTYNLKNGPVQFTASVDDKGELSVRVESNDTVSKVVGDKGLLDTVFNQLKAAELFDATKSNEQLVLDYISNLILVDLEKRRKVEEPVETTEVRITDVERRRQEELKILHRLKDSLNNEKKARDIGTSLHDYNAGINREIKKTEDKISKYDAELADLKRIQKKEEPKKEEEDKIDYRFEASSIETLTNKQAFETRPELVTYVQNILKLKITDSLKDIKEANSKYVESILRESKKEEKPAPKKDVKKEEIIPTELTKEEQDAIKWVNSLLAIHQNSPDFYRDKMYLLVKKLYKEGKLDRIVKDGGVFGEVERFTIKSEGKNFGKTAPPPNTEYRKVGGEIERISPAEIELFKKWHAENVPNIPYEILENILTTHDGEKAWGAFENGVAKFYKRAAKGTEYHEIFEGVYKSFLTSEERQALLDEFKAKSGTFTDRQSGKKISYDQATDKQAKERIADDFADFRLGRLPARTLGEKILKFFRAVLEFFKQFVSKPSLKQQLFKSIDTGRFKELTIPEAVRSELAEYRSVEGLTEQQANEFVQDITARVFQIAFGQNISLFAPEKLTAADIFGQIKEVYEYKDPKDPDAISRMDIVGEKAWNQLIQKTREFLRTFRIEFDEENILSINNEDQDRTLYAPEPFSTDWKKFSPFPVKLLVGSLTETVAENQENSSSLELPKQKVSTVNGYKLFNFSRSFATLMDKLSNTTKVDELTKKLLDLAKSDSNYVRLFTRLKGNLNLMEIDFSKFESHDWRLFVNFFQTFTKQKPDAFIQYINNGEVYTSSANLFTNVNQTKRSWTENMKALSKEKESIITYDRSTKTYKVGDLSEIKVGTPANMVDFLSQIGIEFPMEVYLRLKDDNNETKRFAEAVSSIHRYLGSEKDVMSVTGRTLGIGGQLDTLSELLVKVTNPSQDLSYFGIDQKRRQLYSDNNAASVFENIFNSAETLDQLLEEMPELKDVFSKNSQVLKKGGLFFNKEGKRIKKIKIGYIQGTENIDSGKGTITSALSLGDRFTQEINQNLNGNYYILVPADSSTEWMINLGNSIKFEDIETGGAWGKIYTIFKGYLKDDISLTKENRGYLLNTSPRAQELRFFKDILSPGLLSRVNSLILNDASEDQIDTFINENIADINADVKTSIEEDINITISQLTNTNQIIQTSETSFAYKNLDDNFAKREKLNKYNLSIDDVGRVIGFVQMNYIINNIELHKVLFGDPYQFAIKDNKLDETKRIKSFLSQRRKTFDTPEFNTFLNQTLNTVGDVVLSPNDYGYHQHKSYVSTVTFDDVNVVGSLSDTNPAYKKTNEADAASWVMDNTYREIKLKNGQWSDEAEAWHQWQMAHTRQNVPGYKYTNKKLKEHDIKLLSTPEPKYVIDVLKPIVSGVKNNKTYIDSVLDKFSQMPIYHSAIKGTNLEKLYLKMFKEQIEYGIVISGRKAGAEQLHSLYTPEGEFNEEAFNNKVDVPWKAYGIQVENAYDKPKEQTRGSQLTKLSSLDLFDNGNASPEAQKEYQRNIKLLNLMHRNGYNSLLKKLGIEDLDGSFNLVDNVSVSQSIEREMLRREVSENLKDTVQLDENGEFRIPFEASSAYIQIKDILYSMVDKAIVSPKMGGASHVQVPVTMWESSGEGRKVVEVNGKKVLTDATLKFYTKEDPYMEVMLPAWFKDKLSRGRFKTDNDILNHLNRTEEGKSILKGIGFRIPTQSMSSIENIRVKGFLPSYMGNTVVVPSEITVKAGSDFDIDKLNMYLKSIYTDEKGNIKLVRYKGSEEATKDFYRSVFDQKLERKKIITSDILEALQLIHQGPEYVEQFDTKNLVDRYADVLNDIISQTDNIAEKEEELLQKIEQYGDEGLQSGLREEWADEMYKRSLENEYYDSLEKLLSLPENFERLISPVDDAGLKAVSDRLDDLRGVNEGTIKNRLLSRTYMTSLRHAFVLGKKWVGIGAVNITGHSLTQKSQVFIDPERLELVTPFDRKWLGDGKVVLPHNTINGNVSISGVKTADGKHHISDRLSGYITSFVDVSKDPYILKIVKSRLAVGVFMFLERIGVGENTAFFMNQPIIEKYLEYLDSINAGGLYNKKNIDYIKSQFITTQKQIDSAEIAVGALEDNIKKFAEKGKFDTDSDNAVQHKVLDEFLKYAKMAEYSFKLTQSSNYDTTKLRNADTLFKLQTRTGEARDINIFSSVVKILDESFIGEQSLLLSYSVEAIGEILKLDKYDFRSKFINPILRPYSRNWFLSADNYDRIVNKVITSFIDFIVQTKVIAPLPISGEIKALLVDSGTAVADQLAVAKKEHPEIRLLKELDVTSSDRVGGAKSIKLKANLKAAYDENLYTEMFRELKAALPKLYSDIVKLSILQGTYQSAISISNVIPIEDRAAIISPIIRTLNADNSLDAFAKGAFQRNNWKDDNIFRKISPKFFSQELPIAEDAYGNEIYQYNSPAFPNIPNLGIKSSDRRILFLSEKYNLFDTAHDFILIPRVVEDPKTGERVDMVNGRTVTNAMFKARSVKGDLSLKDVFGYQKVRYANGEPVLSYDKDGNASYVYKLINLWGDGQFAAEYYTEFKPSVLNNGTIKISTEIPDADIISHFSPKLEEKIAPLEEVKQQVAPTVKPIADKSLLEQAGRQYLVDWLKENPRYYFPIVEKDENYEVFLEKDAVKITPENYKEALRLDEKFGDVISTKKGKEFIIAGLIDPMKDYISFPITSSTSGEFQGFSNIQKDYNEETDPEYKEALKNFAKKYGLELEPKEPIDPSQLSLFGDDQIPPC